jgi:phosphatidylglycerophosphate synthase
MLKKILYHFKKDFYKIENKKIWFLVQMISFLRIFMGIMIFYKKAYMLIFFIIGFLADFFDGFLARAFHVTSRFGEILDPIGDKVFIYLIFLSLFFEKSKTILYIIIIKDIMVLIGGIYSRYYFNRGIITNLGKSNMILMGIYLFTNIIKYHIRENSPGVILNLALNFKFLIGYELYIRNFIIFTTIIYLLQYIIIYYKAFIRKL